MTETQMKKIYELKLFKNPTERFASKHGRKKGEVVSSEWHCYGDCCYIVGHKPSETQMKAWLFDNEFHIKPDIGIFPFITSRNGDFFISRRDFASDSEWLADSCIKATEFLNI